MRVFVNAVSIREGGPRVVLVKLLEAMQRQRADVQYCVAAPPAICTELASGPFECLPVIVGQTPFSLVKWYECGLPSSARRSNADVIFSVTNYLPNRPHSIPTLLLEQHAGHFSPIFEHLLMNDPNTSRAERMTWSYKRRWVHRSCRKATVLTVQTAALADAIAKETELERDRIRVIPHGPGWVEMKPDGIPQRSARNAFRIGYVSKFGVQKNFRTLFHAVRTLSEEGLPVRLVLTLNPAIEQGRRILADAERIGISQLIENHGEILPERLNGLYDSIDVFAFPSVCESFGMPMVEAMARGLCIVVADTPENREIVGEAGLPFPAFESGALASLLRRLIQDAGLRAAHSELSLRRARDFSWQRAASDTLAAVDAAASRT